MLELAIAILGSGMVAMGVSLYTVAHRIELELRARRRLDWNQHSHNESVRRTLEVLHERLLEVEKKSEGEKDGTDNTGL